MATKATTYGGKRSSRSCKKSMKKGGKHSHKHSRKTRRHHKKGGNANPLSSN